MLANLMLMKDQTDGAIQSYFALLDKEPDNFKVLSNLIILLNRAGKITETTKYLESAESKTQRSKMAGLAFCKGVYHRYNSEP